MYTEEHFWAYKMLNFKAVWLQQKKATVLHCIINQKVFKISFFLKKNNNSFNPFRRQKQVLPLYAHSQTHIH